MTFSLFPFSFSIPPKTVKNLIFYSRSYAVRFSVTKCHSFRFTLENNNAAEVLVEEKNENLINIEALIVNSASSLNEVNSKRDEMSSEQKFHRKFSVM
jgi:hypothetical protein